MRTPFLMGSSPDKSALDERSPRVTHLLDVARKMFVAAGYDAVSLDSVARAAGVSKETIYRHFDNKEALFRAAARGLRMAFSDRAEHIRAESGPPELVLARFARAIHDSAIEGGYLSALWLTIAVAHALPELAGDLRDDAIQRLEPLRATLERIARERDVGATVPPVLAADFGSLAAEGPRHLMGWPAPTEDERARLALQVATFYLHGGLAVPDGPGASSASAEVAPPDLERPPHIAELMRTAYRHFLSKGFEGASLDEIGAEARVGRGTLYRHFGSKAGIFEAVVLERARVIAALAPRKIADCGDWRSALRAYLCGASAVLTGKDSVALHRLVITEAKRAPELAQRLYMILRGAWTDALAEWLVQPAHGKPPIADGHWHADQLVTLATLGNRPFSTAQAVAADDRVAAVERAIAVFTGGFLATLRAD